MIRILALAFCCHQTLGPLSMEKENTAPTSSHWLHRLGVRTCLSCTLNKHRKDTRPGLNCAASPVQFSSTHCPRHHDVKIKNHLPRKTRTTRMGFEPTRAKHNGLAVHRLNHSATSSHVGHSLPHSLISHPSVFRDPCSRSSIQT